VSFHQEEKFMQIAFTGFTTTRQSPASSRTRSNIGALAAVMVVAALTVLVPTRILARATGEFLPLPAQAKPQDEPPEGYRLQRAGKNGYVVIAGFYQATFVVTSEGVVLIDAPPSLADKLPAAIKSVTSKPVTYVILTHDHYDHIGAATKFAGAKLVAHELTAQLLSVYPDPERPVPTITFSGGHHTLTVGGERFELIYPGPNHETGNIIVYVPQEKLAVMTDLVMPGWVPYRGWGNADHIPGILKAHDALLKLDFDTYVGGHVYRTGTRHDVEQSRAYLVDLLNWTKEEMSAVPFKPAAEPANVWAAQTVWLDQVATRVTARLVTKWKDTLAGTDTFTHDTVIAAIVSLSTDVPKIPPQSLK
jgi:glyoxylase-like metal-dependent hydrolase (beta-lactamase superfamily II)